MSRPSPAHVRGVLHTVAASLGLNTSWQDAWAWFAGTYPGAKFPIAIAGVAAGFLIFWRTSRMPAGRFVGIVAALLLAAMAVAPGPVVGMLLSLVDVALTAVAGFFNRG